MSADGLRRFRTADLVGFAQGKVKLMGDRHLAIAGFSIVDVLAVAFKQGWREGVDVVGTGFVLQELVKRMHQRRVTPLRPPPAS